MAASMGMTNSAACATGDDVALTMAMVRAPAARADLVAATRSGLRPDCEMTMNSALRSIKGVRNAVMTEGALAETGRRSRVSTRYLRKTPAWPELPRPHMTHRGAQPIPIRCAIVARGGPVTNNFGDDVGAFRDFASPSRTSSRLNRSALLARRGSPSDARHDPWRARQRRGEDCRHSFSEWSRHRALSMPNARRTAVLMSPSACSSERAAWDGSQCAI